MQPRVGLEKVEEVAVVVVVPVVLVGLGLGAVGVGDGANPVGDVVDAEELGLSQGAREQSPQVLHACAVERGRGGHDAREGVRARHLQRAESLAREVHQLPHHLYTSRQSDLVIINYSFIIQ